MEVNPPPKGFAPKRLVEVPPPNKDPLELVVDVESPENNPPPAAAEVLGAPNKLEAVDD